VGGLAPSPAPPPKNGGPRPDGSCQRPNAALRIVAKRLEQRGYRRELELSDDADGGDAHGFVAGSIQRRARELVERLGAMPPAQVSARRPDGRYRDRRVAVIDRAQDRVPRARVANRLEGPERRRPRRPWRLGSRDRHEPLDGACADHRQTRDSGITRDRAVRPEVRDERVDLSCRRGFDGHARTGYSSSSVSFGALPRGLTTQAMKMLRR
jgi:hypothetical protein